MKPFYRDDSVTLYHGDALDVLRMLPEASVDCVVTSPPYYGLRDYGDPGQYGLESSLTEYVETMRNVFAEVWRVLGDDGTLWLNLGDSYAGNGKPGRAKSLLGVPWRVAFALAGSGWTVRNAIVWHKTNAMPESVTDRFSTTQETVLLLTKSTRYWFDLDAVREPHSPNKPWGRPSGTKASEAIAKLRGHRPDQHQTGLVARRENAAGANPGDVWSIPTSPFPEAHFAVMPAALAERCILAGCKPGGIVLDPFCGSGTSGMVAGKHGRRFVGIDLSVDYLALALRTRLRQGALIEEAADAPA